MGFIFMKEGIMKEQLKEIILEELNKKKKKSLLYPVTGEQINESVQRILKQKLRVVDND